LTNLHRREFLASAAALAAASAVCPWGRASESQPSKHRRRRNGFAFLHTYESTGRYWKGIEKAGLVRPGNGVRLVNSPWGEDFRRFNEVAKPGGPLHEFLRQHKCHFIVDRVAGGSRYYSYPFDKILIEHYRSLLGEKFLGGQLHETISNTHNDWNRIVKANAKFRTEPVQAEFLRKYFTQNDPDHWLEYGTPDDFAGRVHFSNPETLWKEIERLGKNQAARFDSRFSYCEGSHYGKLAWHVFYRFGAAYCIAEVGPWASERSQFAIASLRGAAKAAGRPWGVFFAPWGPKGCTCFIPPDENSWRLEKKIFFDIGWPIGPEFGCSSAMQRRIFFHAYLSGAHTLHEEWGAEDNLLDWDAGMLSSYGRATRDFLDFQDAHPDVGEPFTPIALVMDASVPPDNAPWNKIFDKLFRYTDADKANAARTGSGKEEAACYPPCALPEIFDVVPSDAPAEVWKNYQEIIPVGKTPIPPGAKACPPEEVYDRLAAAVQKLSPFARATHLPMQINRRKSNGAWIVGIYNPWGAVRGDVENVGSTLNENCAVTDVLRPKFDVQSAQVIHAWPGSSKATLQAGTIPITVSPGGTLILEIHPRV
jgi:hypothetical protein